MLGRGNDRLHAEHRGPTRGGGGADADTGGGGGAEAQGSGAEEGGALTEEQLGLLLQDPHVQRAMAEISADPEAIIRYQDDPIVMGVVQSLSAQ